MKCLRCGYCCKNLCVVVIKDPKLGLKEDNTFFHNGNGKPCIHLLGEKPGEYSCAIHNEKWYKETPCFAHDQVGHPDANCRTGEYMLKKEKV